MPSSKMSLYHKAGDRLLTRNVNHYITDGEVAVAGLVDRREVEESPDLSAPSGEVH
jgi:hypothetical protein